MPARIYLIRHAEIHPASDDPTRWLLSERGKQQAEELAARPFWSEVTTIVTSSEPKAVATVQAIALARGIPLQMRDCLRELKRTPGLIADYPSRVREVFARHDVSIGGWEPAANAQSRVIGCVDGLVRELGVAPMAVVSHGMVLALFLAAHENATEGPYQIWQRLAFASVTLIERTA